MSQDNRLKSLDNRHFAAVRMKIEGRSPDEIAKALGVKVRTVHIWFSDPLVKDEVTSQLEEVNRLFQEKMASAGMRAVEAMVSLLDKPDEDATITNAAKLRTSESLLDRIGVTARVTDQAALTEAAGGGGGGAGGDTTNYTAVFANMPNGDLAEFIKGWQAGDTPEQPQQAVIEQ